MCVRSMNFYAINEIIGDFEATGVVGLAPKLDDESMIYKLFKQDQMD